MSREHYEEAVYEYACHEGNYGLYNILAGARAEETAAEAPPPFTLLLNVIPSQLTSPSVRLLEGRDPTRARGLREPIRSTIYPHTRHSADVGVAHRRRLARRGHQDQLGGDG